MGRNRLSAILALQHQYFEKTCPGFDFLKILLSATENGLDEISVTYIFQNVAPKPHHKVYL